MKWLALKMVNLQMASLQISCHLLEEQMGSAIRETWSV